MKVTCAVCGFEGEVDRPDLMNSPILAFFRHRRPRIEPDIWICDVHK